MRTFVYGLLVDLTGLHKAGRSSLTMQPLWVPGEGKAN